ncbi:MAG: hypothetical protein KBA61_00945 [Spirochaetes bacterium]|nr:hypothetical protein [Spirochaetota bacterium]
MERTLQIIRVITANAYVTVASIVIASCASPQPTFNAVEHGLNSVRFCADDQCTGKEMGFTLTIQDNHVVAYLNLQNTGDLNIITNSRNEIFTDPRIIIKSSDGPIIGNIKLNDTTIDADIVRESVKIIPVESSNGKAHYEIKKTISNPYEVNKQTRQYGDNDIIPQAINIDYQHQKDQGCFIYLTFNLKYESLKDKIPNEKTLNIEKTLLKSICSPPVFFYLKRGIPGGYLPAKAVKGKPGGNPPPKSEKSTQEGTDLL